VAAVQRRGLTTQTQTAATYCRAYCLNAFTFMFGVTSPPSQIMVEAVRFLGLHMPLYRSGEVRFRVLFYYLSQWIFILIAYILRYTE
jgi:hypothetical protein